MRDRILLSLLTLAAIGGLAVPALAQSMVPAGSPTATAGPIAPPGTAPPPAEASWFVEPAWSRLSVDRGPAAREDATWTVDAQGSAAYLFGGRDGRTTFDDLWRFDLATDTWSRLRPRDGPGPRFGHAAAWVPDVGVVIFGGQRGTDFFDELWAYDPGGDRWRRLPSRGQTPAARYGTCAVVDADGRFVISHGFTFNGRFDDTRAYDFGRERWIAISPDGRRPGERCLHDCFLDATGNLVLYGGQDNGARALGDLWVLGDGRWTRQPDPRAAPRRLYGLTVAGADAWVFGGAGRDDRVLDDLWRIGRGALDEQRVRPAGTGPSGRSGTAMIADSDRRRILLFGGESRGAFDELWQLSEPTGTMPPEG